MNTALLLNDSPESTGVGRYAYSLWREMQRLRENVDMALFNYGGAVQQQPGQIVVNAPFQFQQLNRTLNWYFGLPKVVPAGYALYHGTNQHMAMALTATRGIRVLTIHDLIEIEPGEGHPAVRLFTRLGLKHASEFDRIVTSSLHVKREVHRLLDVPLNDIDTAWLGVDHSVFKPGSKTLARKRLFLPRGKKIVLHVGGDEKRKNLAGALLAFAGLRDSRTLFIHVGFAAPRTRRLVDDLGLRKRVLLIPKCSEQELVQYYRAADAFVFPSIHEGFGFPVVEAMACGTPTITSNTTSLAEIAGNAALTADPHDVAGLHNALEKILYDKKLSGRLCRSGIKRSKMFTWRRCAEKTLAAYKHAGDYV